MRSILALILITSVVCQEFDEPVGVDAADPDAQAVYNKTYIEHETELEKELFGRYSPLTRPVLNQSQPIDIYLHWHLVHLSINQKEQTMTVHGHLYMTWRDEKLGWDPEKYNGIRITRSRKWQVWHPKIIVSNSASGVYSAFEISSQAHVLIQSYGKNIGAKVEMYPTFSIKAGCAFDYSDFPDDYNSCTVTVYTPDSCDKTRLKVYGPEIPPTIMFGWGNQSDKNIISDFEILNVNSSVVFYKSGNYSTYEPLTDEEAATTWSMLRLTVSFRRHSALFGINIVLPVFIVFSLMISSFFIIELSTAFYSLMSTMIILAVFMEDLTQGVPLVVMGVPKWISLYGELMILVALAIAVHCLFTGLTYVTNYGPPLFLVPYLDYFRPMAIGIMKVDKGGILNWRDSLPLLRPFAALIFFILFVGSYVFSKIIDLTE